MFLIILLPYSLLVTYKLTLDPVIFPLLTKCLIVFSNDYTLVVLIVCILYHFSRGRDFKHYWHLLIMVKHPNVPSLFVIHLLLVEMIEHY